MAINDGGNRDGIFIITMKDMGRKKCVLVVDDQPKVLRFLEIDLKLRGFEVITTTSGKEALEFARSFNPDIMVLDIVMPEMDGFEVLRQLRGFSQLPVIVFSASITNHDKAMQLGANTFIMKPFKTDGLVSRINSFLGSPGD